MKREMHVRICSIVAILALTIFVLYQSQDSNGGEDICRNMTEPQEIKKGKPEEAEREGKEQEGEGDSAEVEKILAEEKAHEKIELMDYVELSVEEFIEETGIPLCQADENTWNTENSENFWYPENASVWLVTDHGRIAYVSVILWNTEPAFAEAFPYTVAGIRMGMPVSYYKETLLKDAVVENVSYNDDFYINLELSKQGIGLLRLGDDEGIVGSAAVDIDMSLKERAEGLEYVWEERVIQKEGFKNDSLTAAEEPYTEFPESRGRQESIDEIFVWIKYPYLVVPDRPEIEKNANEVIAEAVKKIEENTYGSTDKNIVVDAEYSISYETSRFISICFYVHVIDENGSKPLWQYCNINIEENGRKAYLSDLGISRERVEMRCNAGSEQGPVDTESYLEIYDTNWDQYYIKLTEYRIIVKPLYEEEGNRQYGENPISLEVSKSYGMARRE